MTEQDDPEYHENKIMVEVAKRLGLDPSKVTTIQVEGDGSGEVTVYWTGIATMPEETFQEILAAHKVADSQVEQ